MTTVTVHRKQTGRHANDIRVNDDIGNILENPLDRWPTISRKIQRVASKLERYDYGPSTILGKGDGFMSPFRDAIRFYKESYKNSSWCSLSKTSGNFRRVEGYDMSLKAPTLDTSFAHKLFTEEGDDIIAIGDIHSSIHSFTEVLDNLVHRGILDIDLKTTPGHYIVFLGDIVDRGGFGLDILHICFRLKVSNPETVFIINGNHEDISTYKQTNNGFKDEVDKQLDRTDDRNLIHELMTYLPSAIFGRINDSWIQFNHGGIEPTYNPSSFLESNCMMEYHGRDLSNGTLFNRGLRWNDFSGIKEGISPSPRGSSVKVYGRKETDSYLKKNDIVGIIRGHQDTSHCSILTKSGGDTRDLVPLVQDVMGVEDGFVVPDDYHWGEKDGDWKKITIPDSFRDFSVFTTSTAVSSKDVGYHTYIQLSSSRKQLSKAINDVVSDNAFKLFFSIIGLEEELENLLKTRIDSRIFKTENYQKFQEAIKELKKDHNKSSSILIIDSYNKIVNR